MGISRGFRLWYTCIYTSVHTHNIWENTYSTYTHLHSHTPQTSNSSFYKSRHSRPPTFNFQFRTSDSGCISLQTHLPTLPSSIQLIRRTKVQGTLPLFHCHLPRQSTATGPLLGYSAACIYDITKSHLTPHPENCSLDVVWQMLAWVGRVFKFDVDQWLNMHADSMTW